MWSSAFQFVFQFTAVQHEYAENNFSDCLASFMQKSPYTTQAVSQNFSSLSSALFLQVKKEYFKKTTKTPWQTQTSRLKNMIGWKKMTNRITLESLHLIVVFVCFKKSNYQWIWANKFICLSHQEVKITKELASIEVLLIPLVKTVNFLTTNILSVYLCMSGEKTVKDYISPWKFNT